MLGDRAVSSPQADADVRSHDHPEIQISSAELEREYLDHREAVYAMLRCEFPRFDDAEELYQEAWAELLAVRSRGQHVDHTRALLKKIAWRRAADAVRRDRPQAMDPSSLVFENAPDGSFAVEDDAATRLDADVLWMVIETLDERQAAVLKLRFDQHLSGPEIRERLGLSQNRMEKVVTAAYKAVLDQIQPDGLRESRWQRHQRSLLLACEMGIATDAQRQRAQEMVDKDPQCSAMLRTMREHLRDVAVLLPAPPATFELERRRGPFGAVLDWGEHAVGAARQALSVGGGRAPSSSGFVEHTSTGIAGAFGFGGAAKVVAACLAAGATAAVCIERPFGRAGDTPSAPVKTIAARPATPATRSVRVPVILGSSPQRTTGARTRSARSATAGTASAKAAEVAVSSPKATPSPSPAPAGATEFGPGAAGSAAVAPAPAAASTNGGGEFGP